MAKKATRPVIVWALGLMGLFGSAMNILIGATLLLDQNRLEDFSALNLTDTGLMWVGGISIVVGLFGAFLASSILSGQRWARLWYTFVGASIIVSSFWFILHHSGEERWQAITSLVLWVITLQLLYNDKSNRYFEEYEER